MTECYPAFGRRSADDFGKPLPLPMTSPGAFGGEDEGTAERAAAANQVFVDDPSSPIIRERDRHHLLRVLRLSDGEVIVASDGRGRWSCWRFRGVGPLPSPIRGRPVRTESARTGGGELLFEAVGQVHFEPAPRTPLTVAFAPAKGERSELVVQKLTEIGIDRIVPLVTSRSVVHWEEDRKGRALDRLRRVAAEASAQCRRVWIPEVLEPQTLGSFLGAARVTGDIVGQAQLGGGLPEPGMTCLVVGPEGGWSSAELELGCPRVGLGPNVLRSETAAIVAGVILVTLRTGTVVPRRSGQFLERAGGEGGRDD